MRDTKPCSLCGVIKSLSEFYRDKTTHDGHKARCKSCQRDTAAEYYVARGAEMNARKRARYAESKLPDLVRSVLMLSCPVDAALGVPLYLAPCLFNRSGFRETLAAGYWPDGSIFDFALEYRGDVTSWTVSGCYLLEEGTERVAMGKIRRDHHAQVVLIEAADA